ncbi:MAG: hypothetical protein ACOC1K_05495 [Nanoarchaeota archaeon]
MEQVNLKKLEKDIRIMKSAILEIYEQVIENSLEVSDEVKNEIKEAKERGEFYSQEEVNSMFD